MARLALAVGVGLAAAMAAIAAATWAPDLPVSALQAKWATPPSTFVEVNGLRTHVRDEGPRDDPTPIVLIHGTSASLHTWDGWTQALRGSRRVVRFDLPGFGLTGPDPTGNYSIDAYVRFVTAMLDRLGLQRVVLAGNSLGGQVAWSVAVAQPTRVDRLILIDSAGYDFVPESMPLAFRIAHMPWLAKLTEKSLPRAGVAASLRDVYGHPDRVTPELVDRYHDIARREGNRAALVQRFSFPRAPHPERITSITQPTLVIWGGQDRLIVPKHAKQFVADIKGSRLVMFDDLGHVPQEEDPARTVAAAIEFLQRP